MSLTKVSYSMIDGAVFNAIDFGASPSAAASVNTAAIQAAIDAAALVNGTVFIPTGTYFCNATINMARRVTVMGEGYRSTILSFNHTGAGIKSTAPINSSTAVNTVIKSIGLRCTNLSNTDGGYVDVGGTFVLCQEVEVLGFRYGIIFDQTELAEIDLCQVQSSQAGYAAIWLVDGPSYSPGALTGFTNRISITRCQINCPNTVHGIADDGGYTHVFANNNFNACLNHIRLGGGIGIEISGGEFESAARACVESYTTLLNGGVASPVITLTMTGNVFVATVGNNCLKFNNSCSPITSTGNFYANNGTTPAVAGLVNAYSWNSIGDFFNSTPTSGIPTTQFTSYDFGTFTPVLTVNGSSTGITYATQTGLFRRVGDVVHFSIELILTSKGAGTGSVAITGLPYASSGSLTQEVTPPFSTNIVGTTSVGAWINPADTKIQLQNAVVNYSAALVDTNISNNTLFRLTGSYFV